MAFIEEVMVTAQCSRCKKMVTNGVKVTPNDRIDNVRKMAGLERKTILFINSQKINDGDIRKDAAVRFTGHLCERCDQEVDLVLMNCEEVLRKTIEKNGMPDVIRMAYPAGGKE